MCAEWIFSKKPTLLGLASGVVAGLVDAGSDDATILARLHEFLDPRGFARQRARAKRQSALLTTMVEDDSEGRELER